MSSPLTDRQALEQLMTRLMTGGDGFIRQTVEMWPEFAAARLTLAQPDRTNEPSKYVTCLDAAEELVSAFVRDTGSIRGATHGNELERRIATLLSMQREALKKELAASEELVKNLRKDLSYQLELAKRTEERERQMREALCSLSGCMPPIVYIYGAYGDQWSADEPPTDEYEEINFAELLNEDAALQDSAPAEPQEPTAKEAVCAEIRQIMETYREQEATPYGVDTPGGLGHMGDVWGLLSKWDAAIRAVMKEQPK